VYLYDSDANLLSSLSVTHSTFRYNEGSGVYIGSLGSFGSLIISSGNIHANGTYGVYNASSTAVHAENNWWGDASGPAPYGSGNGINYLTYTCGTPPVTCYDYEYYVDADPWLGQAAYINYAGQSATIQQQQQAINNSLPGNVIQKQAFLPSTPPRAGVPYPQVWAQSGSYFLKGFGIISRYDVNVDWNGSDAGTGSAGRIDFKLNGAIRPGMLTASGGYVELSVDNELRDGQNDLTIVAYNSAGTPSERLVVVLYRVASPRWLETVGGNNALKVTYDSSKVTYGARFGFPTPPFQALAFPDETIPLVGGGWGLKETQVKIDLKADSTGVGALRVSGGTGLKMGASGHGNELNGALFGEGKVRFGDSLRLTECSFGAQVDGKISTGKLPLLSVVTGLPIPDNPLTRKIYLEGSLEPELTLRGIWRTNDGNTALVFDSVNGDFQVTIKGTAGVDVWKDKIEASISLGGTADGGVGYRPVQQEVYVDHLLLKLFLEGKVKALSFVTASFQKDWTWNLAGGAHQAMLPAIVWTDEGPISANWQPVPRDYGDREVSYAAFLSVDRHLMRTLNATPALTTTLVSNLYPYPEPALAVRNDTTGTLLSAWVHDDLNRPQLQGQEILASLWNGASWTTPMSVTNDTNIDLNPQLAFDGHGHAVAVWERVRAAGLVTATLDVTFTQQIEIATAIYDLSSDVWSAVTYLTNNTSHDYAPRLAAGADGTIMLTWIEDPSGDYFATDKPEALHSMIWNGTAWSSSPMVTADITGLLDVSLAYRSTTSATLILSRYMDADPTTETDAELFYATWDGTLWSPLQRLTNNNVQDLNPTALYDAGGALTALWLSDNQMTVLQGNLSGTPVTAPISNTTAGQTIAYRAVINAMGDLALVWQGQAEDMPNLYYAIYDGMKSVWSQVSPLTHDDALEREIAAALTPAGELVLAYAQDQITYTERIISTTLTITNVPTVASTNLVILRYTSQPDLVVDDVALAIPNPAPGQTTIITATIRNAGDRSATPVVVGFYDGAPGTGNLIITHTLPFSLTPGLTATVAIPWDVPSMPVSHTLHVVADPNGLLAEQSEINNTFILTTTMADVMIENMLVYYAAERIAYPIALVRNAGVLTATDVTVMLYRDTITGELLYTGQIITLAPGALTALTTTLDISTYLTGAHILAAQVDPGGLVHEFDETNNDGLGVLKVLPDLIIQAGDVVTSPIGANTAVTITVRNQGVANAGTFTVTVAAGTTITDVNPVLLTWVIPSLAFDEVITLTGMIPGQPTNLYAIVDRERIIEEIEDANNAAWAVTNW